jgi:hypothetical protein
MPMVSKAQNRWMWATHPKMAKEWADKTPNIKALPEHVKPKAKKERHEHYGEYGRDHKAGQARSKSY